jgi:hypothetical protein
MKTPNLPVTNDLKKLKSALKKIAENNRTYQDKQHAAKRLRIVQSVNAGRVRGGHSFH